VSGPSATLDRITTFRRDALSAVAGMTATMDLVLAKVERDIGPELARAVAKALVVHHRHAGGQASAKTKTDRLKRTSFHPSSVRL